MAGHERHFGGRQGAGERPGLLVVDFSLGFTDSASPLACPADSALRATARLLTASRGAGAPVYFTTVAYDEEGRWQARHFIAKVPALATLEVGSRWVAIDERVAPAADEPVLVKRFASAFVGTDLARRLCDDSVDTVFVVGASTSGCVRVSAIDAMQSGHRVLVVRDGVADRDAAAQEATLRDLQAKYADVVDLDGALLALGAARMVAR